MITSKPENCPRHVLPLLSIIFVFILGTDSY